MAAKRPHPGDDRSYDGPACPNRRPKAGMNRRETAAAGIFSRIRLQQSRNRA
jgi:hypothetical protein